MATVTLDATKIKDWSSFHAQSVEAFGFPSFYGKNLNAWIDCLTYLPEGDGMSSITLGPGETLAIQLIGFQHFSMSHREICSALMESVAAVNTRYLAHGDIPRLVLVLQ
jgi:Barstar (barnase inhibitor)